MTIRDMVEQGIEFQGSVKVTSWSDEKCCDIVHQRLIDRPFIIFEEEIMDREIRYMYPIIDKQSSYDVAMLVIELEEEE